jgi:dTDP-4-dehydrorhamnose reductase
LGAFDWDNLLTDSNGCYEPGAFDVRGSSPRSTAIARCLRQLARQRDYQHPLLGSPGWWRREDRLLYAGCAARQKQPQPGAHSGFRRSLRRKLLITGATGTLGRAFQRLAGIRGLEARLSNRQELDIADPARVQTALAQWKPWAVINTAGFVRVDDAEAEEERCWRENVTGPVCLAQVCAALDIPFMTFSSDLVFDGAKESPYLESDAPNPLNVYGQTKAEAEKQVLQLLPAALVIRTSAFFGPWDDHNFVTQTLRRVAAGERVRAAVDSVVSPTYVPDLVNACLDLLLDEEKGIWHIANSGAVSLFQLARAAARWAGLRDELVEEVPASSMAWRAPRPAYSVLGSERGQLLSSWEDALRRCLSEHSRPGKNGAERTGTPRNPLPNPAPETHSP